MTDYSFRLIRKTPNLGCRISCLCRVSTQKKHFWCVALDNAIGLLNDNDLELHERFSAAHRGPITALASDRDGYIASAGSDGCVSVWHKEKESVPLKRLITLRVSKDETEADVLSCAIRNKKLLVSSDATVYAIDLNIAIPLYEAGKKPILSLSPKFTKSHQYHTDRVTCLQINGSYVISGGEDQLLIVANYAAMLSIGDMHINDADEDNDDEMDDALVASYCVEDGIRNIRIIENVALICTDTEQFLAVRIPALQSNKSSQSTPTDLEVVKISTRVRDHPYFKGSADDDHNECLQSASLVTTFYTSRTGRAYLLASSPEGKLALFHISGDADQTKFDMTATFCDANGNLCCGHNDLVRAAEFNLGSIVTVGDDGHVCLWAQSTGVADMDTKTHLRPAPY